MSQQASPSEEVLSYLFDQSAHADGLASLVAKYPLLANRSAELVSLETSLVLGEITLSDVEVMAGQAFQMDAATQREFAKDFVGYFVLPIRNFVPEIMRAFEAIGGVAEQYGGSIVEKAKVSAETVIDEFLTESKVQLSDVLTRRLKLILTQYVAQERDASKTVDMLMREPSIGGMGLTTEIAQNILNMVDKKLDAGAHTEGAAPVVTEPVVSPAALPAVPVIIASSRSTVDDDASLELPVAFDVEERAEVMQEIKELPALAYVAPASAAVARPANVAAEVTRALATTIPVINGEFMTEEERAEVDQHRMPAERAEKMTEDEIEVLSREGQKLVEQLWPRVQANGMTKTAFGVLVESALRGVRTILQFEQQLVEKHRFAKGQAEEIGGVIEKEISQRRLARKQKHLERLRLIEEAEALERAAQATLEEVAANPPKALEPAKVEVSTPSVHPALHGEQKVTDIIYKKQTSGPVDEIGTMTPSDFRLLASRPQDLPDILLTKIEMIGEDGYEERLKAVRAWKRSPANLLYVRLLRDAMLQQKPLPEIIAAERGKGQEVLSPAEIDAIMTINKRLQ